MTTSLEFPLHADKLFWASLYMMLLSKEKREKLLTFWGQLAWIRSLFILGSTWKLKMSENDKLQDYLSKGKNDWTSCFWQSKTCQLKWNYLPCSPTELWVELCELCLNTCTLDKCTLRERKPWKWTTLNWNYLFCYIGGCSQHWHFSRWEHLNSVVFSALFSVTIEFFGYMADFKIYDVNWLFLANPQVAVVTCKAILIKLENKRMWCTNEMHKWFPLITTTGMDF